MSNTDVFKPQKFFLCCYGSQVVTPYVLSISLLILNKQPREANGEDTRISDKAFVSLRALLLEIN